MPTGVIDMTMDPFEYILLLFNTGLLTWILQRLYSLNTSLSAIQKELDEHEKLINYLMNIQNGKRVEVVKRE
jgi:hypothetical protein